MNKLELLKTAVSLATSSGVGTVVGNLVRHTTPPGLTRAQKILVGIGGFALSSLVGDMLGKQAERNIDEAASGFRRLVGDEAEDADGEEKPGGGAQ